MAALPSAPAIDADRFAEITRDWQERAELIEGEIHVIPSPSFRHQGIVGRLLSKLDAWVDANPERGMVFVSPIDVLLSDTDLVQPDVAWWSAGVDLDVQPGPPPDLAVEVLSPGTRSRDIGPKRLAYERAGVDELWLVDPTERAITVLHRSGAGAYDVVARLDGDQVLETPLMAGLAIEVDRLFPA